MRSLAAYIFFFLCSSLHSQNDSLFFILNEDPTRMDSLNLTVEDIILTGNEVTKDEIILREMSLKKGKKLTLKKYGNDLLGIYNTGLFTKVDIIPVPRPGNKVVVNVDVQERWYILPLPQLGIEDGEWAKKWVGLNLYWDNFRGRNESAMFSFRVLYNPSVGLFYSVPWIGGKMHLFSSISLNYSKIRNQSLQAVGKQSGGSVISADEENYDNIRFRAYLRLGKFLTKRFSVFTDFGYDHIKVSPYQEGRTESRSGIDKYLTFGGGAAFDSRNILEYPTRGYYFNANYLRFGVLNREINFGRFFIEQQSYIPVDISGDYFITVASRLFTSLAVGPSVPVYHHEYLGYSEDYVRGWKGAAYEGEDKLTLYNEIRIPVLKPRYVKAKLIPVVNVIPVISNMDLKYGLYFNVIYDAGAIWLKKQRIHDVKFRTGTGIGLTAILPFGYIVRFDWTFKISKPVVGQVGLSLSAKF